MKKQTPFEIQRVDNLGQGVSFDPENNKVNFIPKTLPGEKGIAQILGKKGKKVQFAQLLELTQASQDRIEAQCPHYDKCSACTFLHTHYQKESELKKASYSFLYRNYIDSDQISYTEAPRRMAYRNRVQLHYDKKANLLGYMASDKILPVPECTIALPALQKQLKALYQDSHWKSLVESSPNNGHIELYLKDDKSDEVSIAINERYAHVGFTQVFSEMNDKVINSVDRHLANSIALDPNEELVLDLFGGDGNLTQRLNCPTLVVDYYTEPKKSLDHQSFLSQNLYSSDAIEKISSHVAGRKLKWLIVDPPRSGLKNLDEFVKKLRPQNISYLSCNPNTQVRDIKPLLENGWVIESIEFLDLFPSTYHLESFVHLKKA